MLFFASYSYSLHAKIESLGTVSLPARGYSHPLCEHGRSNSTFCGYFVRQSSAFRQNVTLADRRYLTFWHKTDSWIKRSAIYRSQNIAKSELTPHSQRGWLLSPPTRGVLEGRNRGDLDFVSALEELQKINYREGQWDRFFGLALYYRSLLFSSPLESAHKIFRQNPLALEILALIRHCRFKEALKIKNLSLTLAQTLKVDSSKITKTEPFFKLNNLVGDFEKRSHNTWEKQIHSWPLKRQDLKRLDNPKNLRVKVKNQC